MSVAETGEQTITLKQKDENIETYSACRLLVARVPSGGSLEYINHAAAIWKKETCAELGVLEKGRYLIYVSMDWDEETASEDRFYDI